MEENTKKTLVPIFNIIQDINGKYNIHKWDNSNGCYADEPINKTPFLNKQSAEDVKDRLNSESQPLLLDLYVDSDSK